MSALAWVAVLAFGVPIAYAVVCAALLLYVRVPDEPYYGPIEDLALVVTAPFVAALLAVVLLRRGSDDGRL